MMATKQARELRELDTLELQQRLADAEGGLVGLRFGLATRQTENVARLGEARREIARIRTILHERELEA
jgi:large subunit ribosomal protein L29